MGCYRGMVRSNYFAVTDELAFKTVIGLLALDEDATAHAHSQEIDGVKKFAFTGDGAVRGFISDEDPDECDIDAFLHALQRIVAPGDAALVIEIGFDSLRYFNAFTYIVTENQLECVDLPEVTLETTRKMLGNPEFTTVAEY